MPFSGKVTSLQSISDQYRLRFIKGKIAYAQLSQSDTRLLRKTVQHFLGLREMNLGGSVNAVVVGNESGRVS